MDQRKELDRFNYWSQRVPTEEQSASSSCTSDQGGSQDDGGGSCNADGTGD